MLLGQRYYQSTANCTTQDVQVYTFHLQPVGPGRLPQNFNTQIISATAVAESQKFNPVKKYLLQCTRYFWLQHVLVYTDYYMYIVINYNIMPFTLELFDHPQYSLQLWVCHLHIGRDDRQEVLIGSETVERFPQGHTHMVHFVTLTLAIITALTTFTLHSITSLTIVLMSESRVHGSGYILISVTRRD